MASNKPVIHADDHRRKGALGEADPGGADPINLYLPTGLVSGTSGFDTAYSAPGSLLYLYRMGDTFAFPTSPTTDVANALADTSHYDATHRDLTYHEESAAVGWTTANRPTLHSIEHASLGTADDGCARWTADGAVASPSSFPGAAFFRTTDSVFNLTQTWTAGFNPDPAASSSGTRNALICGSWEGNGSGGASGAGIFYDYVNDRFFFEDATTPFDILGPSGMIRDTWYSVAATYGAGVYTLWINAVSVGTHSLASNELISGTKFRIGGTHAKVGSLEGYFVCGAVDDVAGWSTALTADELASINAITGSTSGAPRSVSLETFTDGV